MLKDTAAVHWAGITVALYITEHTVDNIIEYKDRTKGSRESGLQKRRTKKVKKTRIQKRKAHLQSISTKLLP